MKWKANLIFIPLMTLVTFVVWSVTAGLFFSLVPGGIAPGTSAAANSPSASVSINSLLLASFLTVLAAAWFTNRTYLHGIKLARQIFVILFGVMFFMSQIETIYFGDAVNMSTPALVATIGSGFLTILALAGLTVLFRTRLGVVVNAQRPHVANWPAKMLLLGPIYMTMYFLFGYYVAWQVPELREYYSGSTDILPFTEHMKSVLFGDSWLAPFQILRGLLWAALAYSIAVNVINLSNTERVLLVAFTLAVPLAAMLLMPNPYMPEIVRMGHFYEVLFSQLLFGFIAGWLFRIRK